MLKPYITYRGHDLMEVRCKGDCTTVLVHRVDGVIKPTSEYTSLLLETSVDAARDLLGKHETIVCRACAARILALPPAAQAAALAAIYAQDVHQWIVSAVTAARPHVSRPDAERMAAPFATFVPLRVLSVGSV